MRIAGSTFVVTGGASGLGEATARRLAEAGAGVVVADLDIERGRRLVEQIGDRSRFARVDVTSEEDVQAAVDVAVRSLGGLSGAVSCAGISHAGLVVRRDGVHPLTDFARVLAVNLTGTFNVIRLCAAAMKDLEPAASGERGVFVNTGSVAALEGQSALAAYAASKGGVAAMTLPLARELSRFGIRVVTIAPGMFETPMLAGGTSDEARAAMAAQTPWPPRLGRPDEFAALVAHVIGNETLNGEVIRLDGGMRAGIR